MDWQRTYSYSGYPVKYICWLFIIFMLNIPRLSGQEVRYSFQHITVDDGMKSSRIISVHQDTAGFMWLATLNGPERFSGLDFKHYPILIQDSLIHGNDILNVCEMSDNYGLLCGTRNGNLFRYNYIIDNFDKFIDYRESELLANIYAIKTIDEDVWIGTIGGLLLYEGNSGRLVSFDNFRSTITSLQNYIGGKLWVGTKNGLYLINYDADENKGRDSISTELKLLDNKDVTSLLMTGDTLMVGTRDSRIHRFVNNGAEWQLTNVLAFIERASFPVTDICFTPDENVAVSLDGLGLFIIDDQFTIIDKYLASKDKKDGLSSNGIYDVFFDRNDGLWVATWGGGVNFSDPNKKQFRIEQHLPYVDNSLRSNRVHAVVEGPNNNIWIGTKEGLSLWRIQENKWTHFPSVNSPESDNFHVMALKPTGNDMVWVATYGRGLLRINATTLDISCRLQSHHMEIVRLRTVN